MSKSLPSISNLDPVTLRKGEHPLRFEDISDNALSVLKRLNDKGYDAYLVGGCIRDKFMGQVPKDFDIATNATPDEIKACFRNCRLIGRRFRLAHIVFGRDIIEVATFRGHHKEEHDDTAQSKKANSESDTQITRHKRDRYDGILSKRDQQGQLLRDNVFGTIEEDAERRDFTFNAMYFDARDQSVIDFAHGLNAIQNKQVTMIGDPETRFREDPVRMLRAVRFAAKLDMQIPSEMQTTIKSLAYLLANIPPARLFEEVLKLFVSGYGLASFRLLHELGLFAPLFPQLSPLLVDESCRERQLIELVLKNTDNRINNELRVTPAFLYAALLWYPVEVRTQELAVEAGINEHDAFNLACSEVLDRQVKRIMIPKRFSIPLREIWQLQRRLTRRFGRRAHMSLNHPRFRAAYDFLLIRSEIEGGNLVELADWWTKFQDAAPATRSTMVKALSRGKSSGRRPHKTANKSKPRAEQ